ncbi:MAG: DUF4395 domain-containing protein [Candidatus Krumholzibacteria bacterium]|nr:DUF4395 domain-containing protein [Candidatus Krumholzibacteria bacterium]
MGSPATSNFVKQQGFADEGAESCASHFRALNFQPRIVGSLVVVALLVQSGPLFLALSAVSWWCALVPRLNPFDAIYNRLLAGKRGRPRLTPAPAPRRFAMGMAASFMVAIGVSLINGWSVAAWILQGLLVIALSALTFGKFCLGSYIFHVLRGRAPFANRTLPWARG